MLIYNYSDGGFLQTRSDNTGILPRGVITETLGFTNQTRFCYYSYKLRQTIHLIQRNVVDIEK